MSEPFNMCLQYIKTVCPLLTGRGELNDNIKVDAWFCLYGHDIAARGENFCRFAAYLLKKHFVLIQLPVAIDQTSRYGSH